MNYHYHSSNSHQQLPQFVRKRLSLIHFVVCHPLEIMAETVQFIEQKVHILLLHTRVGDDVAEKVGNLTQWLVAHHQRACVHHSRLEDGRDPTQFELSFSRVWHLPESFRDIPETHIHTLGIVEHKVKLIAA